MLFGLGTSLASEVAAVLRTLLDGASLWMRLVCGFSNAEIGETSAFSRH